MTVAQPTLVLRALEALMARGVPATRTAVILEVHGLSPGVFALRDAPTYPDSKRIDVLLSKLRAQARIRVRDGRYELVPSLQLQETPVPRRSRSAPTPEAPAATPIQPPKPVPLGEVDFRALQALHKSPTLRKFLRGGALTFDDARTLWGATRGTALAEAIARTEDVLARAVAEETPTDPRVPPLATRYGLLNLHRLMTTRFAREIESHTGA